MTIQRQTDEFDKALTITLLRDAVRRNDMAPVQELLRSLEGNACKEDLCRNLATQIVHDQIVYMLFHLKRKMEKENLRVRGNQSVADFVQEQYKKSPYLQKSAPALAHMLLAECSWFVKTPWERVKEYRRSSRHTWNGEKHLENIEHFMAWNLLADLYVVVEGREHAKNRSQSKEV